MHSSKHAAKQQQQQQQLHLNYFQQSPVRGQLEPSDGFSKTGWRYLQCTDTPNELRVLLPPRTAMIYAHLLRAEMLELAKDKAASWDRIMEIRHLKDRMIRKCQRLARGATIRDKNTARVMFFTVHAPPDFRMKELERWFRSQGPEITQTEDITPRAAQYCCEKCGPLLPPQVNQSRPSAQSRRSNSQRSTSTKVNITERIARRPSASQLASAPRQPQTAPPTATAQQPSGRASRQETSPPPLPVPTRSRSISHNAEPPRQQVQSRTPPYVSTPERSRQASPSHGIRAEQQHPPRASIKSPDPVPIPYRPPHESDDEVVAEDPHLEHDIEIRVVDRSPSPIRAPSDDDDMYGESPSPSPPIAHTPDPDKVAFPGLETIHEGGEGGQGPSRPTLPRRRSSLKKSGSISRLSMISQSKSVTWAMDRDWVDQMAKFVEVTKDAEMFAEELYEVRADYHNKIHEMREVCRNVTSAADKIRSESESLHREEIALREQEDRVLMALERMELKESEYHQKVISVLEETKRVVQLCDKKRDHHDA